MRAFVSGETSAQSRAEEGRDAFAIDGLVVIVCENNSGVRMASTTFGRAEKRLKMGESDFIVGVAELSTKP
jgi:hypothetical protein